MLMNKILLISLITAKSLSLRIDPPERVIEAFTGQPFTINCDDDGQLEQNPNLRMQWMSPTGELVGKVDLERKEMPVKSKKFRDFETNVIDVKLTSPLALVAEEKQNSGVYRCLLVDVSILTISDLWPVYNSSTCFRTRRAPLKTRCQ